MLALKSNLPFGLRGGGLGIKPTSPALAGGFLTTRGAEWSPKENRSQLPPQRTGLSVDPEAAGLAFFGGWQLIGPSGQPSAEMPEWEGKQASQE